MWNYFKFIELFYTSENKINNINIYLINWNVCSSVKQLAKKKTYDCSDQTTSRPSLFLNYFIWLKHIYDFNNYLLK